MGSKQYTSQTEKRVGGVNVQLRTKPQNFLSSTQNSRSSKVTSMIELFSEGGSVDFASIKPKPVVRNSTFLSNDKKSQEVVGDNKLFGRRDGDVISTKSQRKTGAGTVSVGIRVPKPFIREKTNFKENLIKQKPEHSTTSIQSNTKEEQKTFQVSANAKQGTTLTESNLKAASNRTNCAVQNIGFKKPSKNTESGEKVKPEKDLLNSSKKPEIPNNKPNVKKCDMELSSNNQKCSISSAKFTNPERKSPNITPRMQNGGARSPILNMDKKEERRISNARNYWEHKLTAKRNMTTRGGLTPYKSESNLNSISPSSVRRNFSPSNFSRSTSKAESESSSESGSNFGGSPPPVRPMRNNWSNSNQLSLDSSSPVPPRSPSPRKPPGISPPSPSLKPRANFHNATVKNDSETEKKPVVPSRPRFMTATSSLHTPPRPFASSRPVSEMTRVPSAIYSIPQKIKPASRNTGDFQERSVSPLVTNTPPSPPPRSPRETKTPNKDNSVSVGARTAFFNEKTANKTNDGNNNVTAVNPLPKPQRTFTFSAADTNPRPLRTPKPLHRNLIRVSSDLTTIEGSSIQQSLESAFLNDPEVYRSTPNVSAASMRMPEDGYEEVTFFKPGVGKQQQTESNRTRKWRKQHNYEEVEDNEIIENNNVHQNSLPHPSNYDRIDLQKAARPLSLSDLDSNYSHLTFQQDLHRARQGKPSMLLSSTSPDPTKLSKQNSNMSETLTRSNSISKSERSMESGMKLQITDKIREAFSQISRKYKHHRKYNIDDSDSDAKSLSSSGDEDSDTEMDLSKHRQTLDRTRTMQKTYRNTLKYKSLERELSGSGASTLFEQVLICKIVTDKSTNKISSKVSYRFPTPPPGKTVGDEKTLAHFCYPDIDEITQCEEMLSQSYSFMLTREDGTRKFGYCRRILPPGDGPRYPVVYCLISALGSFGLYETILDELERRHRASLKKVSIFIELLFVERFPAPGRTVRVEIDEPEGRSYFMLRRPFDTRLEHVDLQCLLSELGVENTIKIFASLLLERRVIISGKSLSMLTACIHAFRALLYPFIWQHVFVPVLPPPMVDLCCSPTPLLIGILETSLPRLRTLPLEEVFLVNLCTQEVLSCAGDELDILPRKLQTPLIDSLNNFANNIQNSGLEPSYDFAMDYESAERNTVISESFMHLFVEMIGHYQNHFQTDVQSNTQSRWGKIHRTFNRISFYEDVTSRSLRRFLDLFMGTQIFDGFIHSRELTSPDYEGLFEIRIARHLLTVDASNLNFKVFKTKMKRLMQGIGKKKI